MKYRDLRDFMGALEGMGELRRVADPVSPVLEMTALSDLVLRAEGPALLFERPTGHRMPVLANLFGTPRRVALGMGAESTTQLRRSASCWPASRSRNRRADCAMSASWRRWPRRSGT